MRQIGFEDEHFLASPDGRRTSGILKRHDAAASRSRAISEDKLDMRARTISTVVRDSKRVDFIFDVLQAVVK